MIDWFKTGHSTTVCCLFVLLTAAGCSSIPNPKDMATDMFKDNPPKLQGAIFAGSSLNQRSDGVATSVVVQLMELSDVTEFQQQDFFAIVRSPKQVLGNELLDIKEYVMLPDKTELLLPRELAKGTTHLGIVADFRDWSTANWRQVIPLPHDKTTRLKVVVDGNSVTATTESRRWWRKTQSAMKK